MVRSYSEVGFAVPVELSKIPASAGESLVLALAVSLRGALRRMNARIKKIKKED